MGDFGPVTAIISQNSLHRDTIALDPAPSRLKPPLGRPHHEGRPNYGGDVGDRPFTRSITYEGQSGGICPDTTLAGVPKSFIGVGEELLKSAIAPLPGR